MEVIMSPDSDGIHLLLWSCVWRKAVMFEVIGQKKKEHV